MIRRGELIGLMGSIGSGKSTTVDLLMGLLAWRAAIAHVPQSIYLADSSIAENIAFGIPKNQIDITRVRDAAGHPAQRWTKAKDRHCPGVV